MTDPADIANRFQYHPADSDARKNAHEGVRIDCRTLADQLNDVLPEGREKALAMTKLEEVMFWANAAIARNPSSKINPAAPLVAKPMAPDREFRDGPC